MGKRQWGANEVPCRRNSGLRARRRAERPLNRGQPGSIGHRLCRADAAASGDTPVDGYCLDRIAESIGYLHHQCRAQRAPDCAGLTIAGNEGKNVGIGRICRGHKFEREIGRAVRVRYPCISGDWAYTSAQRDAGSGLSSCIGNRCLSDFSICRLIQRKPDRHTLNRAVLRIHHPHNERVLETRIHYAFLVIASEDLDTRRPTFARKRQVLSSTGPGDWENRYGIDQKSANVHSYRPRGNGSGYDCVGSSRAGVYSSGQAE
jgi:hypothetical protein